jgi:DNA-binding transcriptional ArsR family regulator
MTNRQIKDQLFAQVATLTKSIASPKRLELLELLAQAPKTVEQLAEEAEMSIALTSAHLKALKSAQCVRVKQEGKYRRYEIANEQIAQLWVILHRLAAEQLPELQQQLTDIAPQRTTGIQSVNELIALAEQQHIQLILVSHDFLFYQSLQALCVEQLCGKLFYRQFGGSARSFLGCNKCYSCLLKRNVLPND